MTKRKKHEFYRLTKDEQMKILKEVAVVFLKLGATAFGGPAAHVAMMEDEIVTKRKWLPKDKFLDIYGATNLLPGPNSTELAIHLGYERGGWKGLALAGVCFISPAMMIVLAFAAIYVSYGSLPELSGMMYGIKPVIIAVILQALIRLWKSAIKNTATGFIGVSVMVLSFLGWHELLLLFGAGFIMLVISNYHKLRKSQLMIIPYLPLAAVIPKASPIKNMSMSSIFFTFLKIGSVLYGSGYVIGLPRS